MNRRRSLSSIHLWLDLRGSQKRDGPVALTALAHPVRSKARRWSWTLTLRTKFHTFLPLEKGLNYCSPLIVWGVWPSLSKINTLIPLPVQLPQKHKSKHPYLLILNFFDPAGFLQYILQISLAREFVFLHH